MGVRVARWTGALVALLAACGSETAGVDGPQGGSGGVGAHGAGTATGTTTGGTGPGGTGGGPAGGAGGTGGGPSCADQGPGEPNQTELTAFEIEPLPISDCDGDGAHIAGVIRGPDDVDWFFYRGNDGWCSVNPTRALEPADAGLRVCAFFDCMSAPTELDGCPSGTDEATSPAGRPGCCGSAGFTVGGLNCSGTIDDDAFVYLRVDVPGIEPGTCADYVLSYHY